MELFGRLNDWQYLLIAADRNLFDGRRQLGEAALATVPTTPVGTSEATRVLHWASFALAATIRGLLSKKPDVVYASSPHLLSLVAGRVIAKLRRAVFVVEVRDLWPEVLVAMGRLTETSRLYRFLRRLERGLYRSADHVVVLAKGSVDAVAANGVPRDRITWIPNSAEPSDFDPPVARAELKERFGLSGLVFVYAGAHGQANGLDFVLDAAERIHDDLPDVQFVLVGDGTMKPHLVRNAGNRGLSNVIFLDPIPKSVMPALLGAADVGLHVLADVDLFRYGVSPNKVFDYMAAGLPVVTNTPGEVGDLVERAGAGLATEFGRVADGIVAMATASSGQREKWGEAGRAYIANHQSRELMAARLEQLLDRLVTDPPASRM